MHETTVAPHVLKPSPHEGDQPTEWLTARRKAPKDGFEPQFAADRELREAAQTHRHCFADRH